MKFLLEWIGQHPVLTIIMLIIGSEIVADVVKAIFRR
jgi:hypothetical protein